MARLRQLYPANYRTSNNVNAEFENVIRYLVSAERGNKTLAEKIYSIFNERGEFAPPLEFRVDPSAGLEYRIGEYDDSEDGWVIVAPIEEIRGPGGVDIGLVESPFFYNRQDLAAAEAQTEFSYAFGDENADVLVFKNGVLLAESEYTKSVALSTITLVTPFASAGTLTVGAVRDAQATGYDRSDLTAADGQAVFPAEFSADDVIIVYRNGLLQTEGGTADYVASPELNVITLMTAATVGESVVIVKVQDNSLRRILGVMTEDKWSDGLGFIPYNKLSVDDDEVPRAKVNGLNTALDARIVTYFSPSEPSSPATPSLWVQTTANNSLLWFYDGFRFNRTTPIATLPDFTEVDAGQFIAVNQTGTGFELSSVNLTSVVPKSWVGANNGVAPVGGSGKIPESFIPEIFTIQSLSLFVDGAVANTTYNISRIYRQSLKIDGISARVSSGSCRIQLAVDGAGVGPTLDVTTSGLNHNLGDIIVIDTAAEGKRLSVIVTNNSAGQNFEIGVSAVSKNA